MLRRLWSDTTGAAAVEYGLLAALVAMSLVAVLLLVGHKLDRDLRKVDPSVAERMLIRT